MLSEEVKCEGGTMSSHDGFEALQGENRSYCASIAASTSTGVSSEADVHAALAEVACWAQKETGAGGSGSERPLFVYGKSWGGARAVFFASEPGGPKVEGLALACPSPKVEGGLEERIAALEEMQVLLVWANLPTLWEYFLIFC